MRIELVPNFIASEKDLFRRLCGGSSLWTISGLNPLQRRGEEMKIN